MQRVNVISFKGQKGQFLSGTPLSWIPGEAKKLRGLKTLKVKRKIFIAFKTLIAQNKLCNFQNELFNFRDGFCHICMWG